MSATSKERLLKKLQKLKALATDPTGNANEAANAAARMTEIMIQEGISLDGGSAALGSEKTALVGCR